MEGFSAISSNFTQKFNSFLFSMLYAKIFERFAYNKENHKEVFFLPRTYKMSADVSEKEKIVGGMITAGQAGWLAGGGGIIAVLLSLFYFAMHLPALVAVVLALPPGLAFGIAFAFYKKEELTLYRYLTLKHQYKAKEKVLLNSMNYHEPKASVPANSEKKEAGPDA